MEAKRIVDIAEKLRPEILQNSFSAAEFRKHPIKERLVKLGVRSIEAKWI